LPALPNKDIETEDAMMGEVPKDHKRKAMIEDKNHPVTKTGPRTRPLLENVVMCEKTDHGKKRASPAYHFARKLQENVNIEALYKSLMEKEVTVKLGDILRSLFELSKRLQITTKMQHVPVKLAAAGSNNVKATINPLEHTSESMPLALNSLSIDQTLAHLPEDLVDLLAKSSPVEPTDLKPGEPK
jgi:Protein of unknown function (DUF4100)